MIYRNALLFICWALVYGQPPPAPPGVNVGVLTDQARRFIEIYGLATQLMNFGDSIINNAKDVYDSTGYDGFGLSGNGVSNNDLIRPQAQGVRSSNHYRPLSSSSLLTDYGGGLLGSSSRQVQSARQSGIETLLNTFLGPSFFGQTTAAPATSLENFFKPSYQTEDYHPTGGSNIDRLISMLTRSGARRAAPEPLDGSQNLLQAFFGKR